MAQNCNFIHQKFFCSSGKLNSRTLKTNKSAIITDPQLVDNVPTCVNLDQEKNQADALVSLSPAVQQESVIIFMNSQQFICIF